MKEIELSVMFHGETESQTLAELVKNFEKKNPIRVRITTMQWAEAWSELVKIALYNDGPDVSEIGNTWVSDFAKMVALHSFTPAEINALGGQDSFLASSWESATGSELGYAWAIPWLVDTRILFYRRDLLQNAGVNEETAFQTHAQLKSTLEQLQKSGVHIPWVVPTRKSRMTLHHVSSWVWGAGGRFLSQGGRRVMFDQPEAIKGLLDYFGLIRFMPPEARDRDERESDDAFSSGKAALTISGPWMLSEQIIQPKIRAKTGFVSPPGLPYVGGSHLVIWRHSRATRETLELVKYLTSPEVQTTYCQAIGSLPTRLEALSDPYYHDDPFHQRLINRLKDGRSFRPIPLWGMVEDRLTTTLGHIWQELLDNPDQDIESVIKSHIEPLASRLNMTLTQR